MGKCIYCGEDAGFLRKAHRNCKAEHKDASKNVGDMVAALGQEDVNLQDLMDRINREAQFGHFKPQTLVPVLRAGWDRAVDNAFNDGLLTKAEERNLLDFAEEYSLDQTTLDTNGAYSKVIKGAILREVMNGQIPEKRIIIDGTLPFNFQKSEKLIWVFQNVEYLKTKRRTQYVGGSKGLSVRVAKGVYLRAGAFKGERVNSEETIHADTGILGITNKHMYFAGPRESFRVRFDKIVSFQPYSDGIGIQRDAQTAKPQTFKTNDGWFAYNLITNAAQL